MWSNDYIKIPFLDHGRTSAGCDCWGLACLIYKDKFGIELPALLDYKDIKDGLSISKLYEVEHRKWEEIKKGEEKPFDILVFKIMGLPTHIGIVIEKGFMIHCEKDIGTHVTEYNTDIQWRNRFIGAYRYAK